VIICYMISLSLDLVGSNGVMIIGKNQRNPKEPLLQCKFFHYFLFFNFPLYLQSVPIHSANDIKPCTKACRRMLNSTLLYLIGSESSCDLGIFDYDFHTKSLENVPKALQ
jgi:hypothetical protein